MRRWLNGMAYKVRAWLRDLAMYRPRVECGSVNLRELR